MKKRLKFGKKRSRKLFKKTARGAHVKNYRSLPKRGGNRM